MFQNSKNNFLNLFLYFHHQFHLIIRILTIFINILKKIYPKLHFLLISNLFCNFSTSFPILTFCSYISVIFLAIFATFTFNIFIHLHLSLFLYILFQFPFCVYHHLASICRISTIFTIFQCFTFSLGNHFVIFSIYFSIFYVLSLNLSFV